MPDYQCITEVAVASSRKRRRYKCPNPRVRQDKPAPPRQDLSDQVQAQDQARYWSGRTPPP